MREATGRKKPFPGVTRVVDRHGKLRWRFRRKGRADLYLPGAYGSAEFRTAYETALEGVKVPVARTTAQYGTLSWLIEQYLRSPKHLNLSDVRRALIRHDMASQRHNPARHADRRKENPDGYHTWTEAEIAQFLAHHGPGTKARLAVLLILNTGAARQDLVRMGWQNVKEGRISYRRHKTGVGGDYRILDDLAAELRSIPQDQLLFFTHSKGRPYQPATFGNWFRDQCGAAGLAHCSAHGLRKGLATLIAESGATELQIIAVLAHSGSKEGATYVKKANRWKLADQGLALSEGAKTERNASNLVARLNKARLQPTEQKAIKLSCGSP